MTEIVRDVIRIGLGLINSLVTLVAVRVLEPVISVRVARETLNSDVTPRQLEICSGVIERCRRPRNGGMASHTIQAEAGSLVAWIRRILEIIRVALATACIDELIIAIHVAGLAFEIGMLPCQRKLRGIVIKCCWTPGCRSMTVQA